MPRRLRREAMPYARGGTVPRGPDRRVEERRAPWTDEDEAQYQAERRYRAQNPGQIAPTEFARINQRMQEEDRRKEERRQAPITVNCPECKTGEMVGNACNNCGTTMEEVLNKPTSREQPTEYQPSPYLGKSENPSDPKDVDARENDDGNDSVLDALEEKVVPEGRKKADVSNPPGAQTYEQNKTSMPPGAIVPPAEGGPSTPPDQPIPQHETAQPFVGYEGVDTGNAAVDQQIQMEINNQGINPEQARQRALELQQNALRKQHQEGWAPTNMYQLTQPTASKNPVGRILSQFDEGFVSTAALERAKKLLS